MASIVDIVLAGKGRAGKWAIAYDGVPPGNVRHLYHYSHRMLTWNIQNPTDESVLWYDTGWGSVSDQGGMNRAFRALGIPRYFRRKGGAEIIDTTPWYSHV